MAKDAYYFKHDSNARNDPKIRALIKRYGVEGYGRFWIAIEFMREETGYRIVDEEFVWESLAEQMHCDVADVHKFFNDCVNKFKLFAKEDKFFYSPALLERMNHLDEIRQKRKYAAEIRWKDNI